MARQKKEYEREINFLGVKLTLAKKNNSKVTDSDFEDSLVYKNDDYMEDGFRIRVIFFEPNRPYMEHFECLLMMPKTSKTLYAETIEDLEEEAKHYLKNLKNKMTENHVVY